jgi:hypothetical protein
VLPLFTAATLLRLFIIVLDTPGFDPQCQDLIEILLSVLAVYTILCEGL